jgi:hypothetical protein
MKQALGTCHCGGTDGADLPAFYARHDFEVVATIDDHPTGYRNLLMRKRLAPV